MTEPFELPDRDLVVTRAILEKQATARPQAPCAMGVEGEGWTWAEALETADRAASALTTSGVEAGHHVLIFLPNGLDWLRAWWGIASLGAVMVTVNVSLHGETLRHVCSESGASVIIADPTRAELVAELGLGLEVVDPAQLAAGDAHPPVLDRRPQVWDVHAINFTSGTTGPAKGVLTPYLATYMGGVNAMGAAGGLTAEDRWLVDTPLFHVSGQMTALVTMSAGAAMVVRERFAGADYWSVVAETGATHSLLVGTMAAYLQALPPSPAERAHRLQVVVLAPMVPDPVAFQRRYGVAQLCSVYGQTEISSPLLIPPGAEIVLGSVGRPRKGVEVRIVDDHDVPVPVGLVGELVVRTERPWEMNLGYVGHPAESMTAWRNGWFHTGDAFRRDAEDNFFYVDRIRDTLRRRGENISSFEVEAAVSEHPDVLEAACVGIAADLGEQEVKVFVVPVGGRTIDPLALLNFLIERLPRFMLPRFVEVVSDLPKNQTLRVQKFALRSLPNTEQTWDRLAVAEPG